MYEAVAVAVQTDGSTSLLRAARSGNVERVVDLLAAGKIDINTCNAVANQLPLEFNQRRI